MIFKELITLLLTSSLCVAWPIVPQAQLLPTQLRKIEATCGNDIEQLVAPNQPTQLYMTVNNQAPGCTVHWRLGIKNTLGVAHYGIKIAGIVDIMDDTNDENCLSSFLSITDADVDDDEDVTSMTFCDKTLVKYITKDDSVNVKLVIGSNGASGKGFNITITPENECGEIITQDTRIHSPRYPAAYPKNAACLWEIKIEKGLKAELECSYLKLLNRRNRCVHYLQELYGKLNNKFCEDDDLKGVNKRTYTEGEVALYFRSSSSMPKGYVPGFDCSVKFLPADNARKTLQDLIL